MSEEYVRDPQTLTGLKNNMTKCVISDRTPVNAVNSFQVDDVDEQERIARRIRNAGFWSRSAQLL